MVDSNDYVLINVKECFVNGVVGFTSYCKKCMSKEYMSYLFYW